MKWYFDAAYDYGRGLPGEPREIHGFVLRRSSEIRQRLVSMGVAAPSDFLSPAPVSDEDLLAVHTRELVAGLRDPEAIAVALELPEAAMLPPDLAWQAIVAPQLLAAGGTCEALARAARGEWAINLSGGFHHARRDLSHGFCLVNDVALAVARLRRAEAMQPLLIVDLDLHQGDGNASFFEDDPDVFTLSVHEERIFPMPKMRSHLDVGLPACAGDGEYLDAVDRALSRARERFEARVVVYVAGSDPYEDDPLGSLAITKQGLLERDRKVARFAAANGCALVALPAGGYCAESPTIAAAGFAAIAALEPAR